MKSSKWRTHMSAWTRCTPPPSTFASPSHASRPRHHVPPKASVGWHRQLKGPRWPPQPHGKYLTQPRPLPRPIWRFSPTNSSHLFFMCCAALCSSSGGGQASRLWRGGRHYSPGHRCHLLLADANPRRCSLLHHRHSVGEMTIHFAPSLQFTDSMGCLNNQCCSKGVLGLLVLFLELILHPKFWPKFRYSSFHFAMGWASSSNLLPWSFAKFVPIIFCVALLVVGWLFSHSWYDFAWIQCCLMDVPLAMGILLLLVECFETQIWARFWMLLLNYSSFHYWATCL